MAQPRVFLDANVLFTAAYSPQGISALLIELAQSGRFTVLTSALAAAEAHRNLQLKRPAVLRRLEAWLSAIELTGEPSQAEIDRLTPANLAAKDRPVLAAAIAARATHFVTGDRRDFGRWLERPAALPLRVLTPRQFLTEISPASGR